MARINNRPSTVASSRYASVTPGPNSDQENQDPAAKPRDKGKQRAMPPPSRNSLPTPTSENSDGSRGQKRKRAERASAIEDEDEDEDEEKKLRRHYDPQQDPKEAQANRRRMRANGADLRENRDEHLRGDGYSVVRVIDRANLHFRDGVRQTADATIDSRLMTDIGALAAKKAAEGMDLSTRIDVDEFLSKCITYMRNGGPINNNDQEAGTSTQRRRRARNRDDDEDEDDVVGEALDWEFLGRHACFPYNNRPPVPSFLLGPLSVEKKVRKETQRRARQTKDTAGREVRPEALTREDLQQTESNDLRAICTKIRIQLRKHIERAQQTMERAGFTTEEDAQTEECKKMLRKCKLADNAGVPLFEFVVNPRSFGQTVENLFYISFLIKEGSIGVSHDTSGLPTLNLPGNDEQPNPEDDEKPKPKEAAKRRQAVFSLDYDTWRQLSQAFDIRESMIEHRKDEQPTQMGERGWYA